MPEQNKPFVVTDRRKFTLDGELRPDAEISPETEERETPPPPAPVAAEPQAASPSEPEPDLPPAPSAEQTEQSRVAYEMTADRLDTAIRAANPGMDHLPPMSF